MTVTLASSLLRGTPGAAPSSGHVRQPTVRVSVGQRVRAVVAYPRSAHPAIPQAADPAVLCEISHTVGDHQTVVTFLGDKSGTSLITGTLNLAGGAARPYLSALVTVMR